MIINKKNIKLDSPVPVYCLNVDHDCHNFSLSNGNIVKNCVTAEPGVGKSNFLMIESIAACMQGKRVHYLAAGDLVPTDFLIRMSSQALKIPITEVYLQPHYYIEKTKELLGGRFKFSCVPSNTITADEYTNYMISVADQYDMFVVDYDTNIATLSDNMYGGGGELYDNLTKLSRLNKLVFVASQPKIAFYGHEIVPIQALSESSRKQQIIDIQITIGKAPKSAYNTGYVSVVKNRRGTKGSVPYVMSSCLVPVEIHKSKYDLISANPSKPGDHQVKYEYLINEALSNQGNYQSTNISDLADEVKRKAEQDFIREAGLSDEKAKVAAEMAKINDPDVVVQTELNTVKEELPVITPELLSTADVLNDTVVEIPIHIPTQTIVPPVIDTKTTPFLS